MIKLETFGEDIIYINSKYIQSIRENDTAEKGSIVTLCGETYIVKGSPEHILKLIKEVDCVGDN